MTTHMRIAYVVRRYTVEALRGSPYGMFISLPSPYDLRLDSMSENNVPPKWRPRVGVGHSVVGRAPCGSGPNGTLLMNQLNSREDIQQ